MLFIIVLAGLASCRRRPLSSNVRPHYHHPGAASVQSQANLFLIAGAALSAIAALLHFACIFLGAPAFRTLGAGEKLARMAERGHWYPALVAFGIGVALSVCAAYALSAAGLLPRFPLLRTVLSLFAATLLLRAIAFPLLRPVFPENSTTFWLVSSAACLSMGLVHAVWLSQVWVTP